MVNLQPEEEQQPTRTNIDEITVSGPISRNRTITPTDSATLNQVSFPSGLYGGYFTGAIVNHDATNWIDVGITDVTGISAVWPVPPNGSLNMKNQSCSVIQIQLDPLNPAASVAYQLSGKVLMPLTPRAQQQLDGDSEIFFRVKPSAANPKPIVYVGSGFEILFTGLVVSPGLNLPVLVVPGSPNLSPALNSPVLVVPGSPNLSPALNSPVWTHVP